MTIIERIKAEIERLTDELELQARENAEANNGEATDYCFGVVDMQMNLLSFLTTLESEKPMNLEEEINRYLHEECSDDDEPGIHEIAEHFAQWGAEHLASAGKTLEIKPGDEVAINGHKIVYDKDKGYVTIVKSEEGVPNDLEEAADKYAEELTSEPYLQVVHKTDFIAGAKWQAEQLLKSSPLPEDTVLFNKGVEEGKRLMMEEAVEGEVMTNGFYPYEPRIVAPYPNCPYDFGDKVRVIVLPKED